MHFPRSSGVLLHPTSLPGPYGIGTLGTWAYRFVDFLADAGQKIWQVLPLGPTGYGDSPYQSFSSHAGNINLIDLDELIEMGLLEKAALEGAPEFSPALVDYCAMHEWKRPLLYRVGEQFRQRAGQDALAAFERFCQEKAEWLDDYATFMACKEAQGGKPWREWPKSLKRRSNKALATFQKKHEQAIEVHKVLQWLFFHQWSRVRAHAAGRDLRILGDLPIFVAMDSADAWVNPELFHFDKELEPTVVAGVPPDYFSATGQLWGNPLYRWDKHKKQGYEWWMKRLSSALGMFDFLRIDHFRGFAGYWQVPAGEETAVNGKWVKGPGSHFFKKVKKEFPDMPIVAEDLGDITPDVHELRDEFGLPGMVVIQFAFGGGPDNKFLPHHHQVNSVVYTGTHDNDTSLGWYKHSSTEAERQFFHLYTGVEPAQAGPTLVRMALNSVAHTAIVPFQDILGMGSECRMNTPSQASGNWQWRFLSKMFTRELMQGLRGRTYAAGRLSH